MPATVEDPLGFPRCRDCYWLQAGSSEVCFACASAELQQPKGPRCPTCSQELPANGVCGNPLCGAWSRSIGRIHAIAVFGHPVERTIRHLKYDGKKGWALIFGRLVHGWLNANMTPADIDLIVANPTCPDPAQPGRLHHTELVLDAARTDDALGRWPFDRSPYALVKPHPTPPSAGRTFGAKKDADRVHAESILIDAARIAGRRLLIYDDVCTTGYQLEFVAERLVAAGATSVDALVIARAPYRPK